MLRELHLADWRATKDTLHLYCQVVGKVRLATTSPRNHWWNVPLYVDVRGLTTRRLHHGDTTSTSASTSSTTPWWSARPTGAARRFALHDGLDVAEFDRRLHAASRAGSGSTSRSGSCRSACR